MKKIFKISLFSVYLLVLYLGFLYYIQTDILFHPDKNYISPKSIGMNEFQEHVLTAQDGTQVMTWFYPGDKSKPALLFFHGNSGQISGFMKQFEPFVRENYTVLAMEYRSFGNTNGEITQQNIMGDTALAYDFLKQQGYQKVVAYGYSFGTAFASALSSVRPVDGIILIAPFASLTQLASEKPVPLATWVLKDTYPSVDYLKVYSKSLLIAHGKQDEIIPYQHSEKLYQEAGTERKKIILMDNDNHVSVYFHPTYLESVFQFLTDL